MNRWLTLSLSVLVALPALADAWSKKLSDFHSAAYAERKKLGLDKDQKALYAKYPTPEVQFLGATSAEGIVICPDETKAVTLAGKIAPGSLVGIRGDDLEVVKEAITAKGWEATVHAKKTATPHQVDVTVVAPVSAASQTRRLVIGCNHTWTFVVGEDTLVVKTKFGATDTTKATGEWKRAGKLLGTVPWTVWASTGNLRLEQDVTPEDQMAQAKAMQDLFKSAEMKALEDRTNAVSKKMGECGKLPPAKMGPCFEGPKKEMDAIAKEREALQAKAEIKGSPAFGCRRIDVEVKDGKLSGEAEACAGKRSQERMQVTGSYTSP
ncbi:MAG: hypothetical protein AB1938_03005 [Myxococcota bacterium]